MFDKARRKLTLLYLLIIMAVSISFSTVVYKVSTRELDRFSELQRVRIERRIHDGYLGPNIRFRFTPAPLMDPQLVVDVKNRTAAFLIILNSAILVFSTLSGYFLADKTLAPIKEMMEEQDRFISDASHELKTPLTSLKLALEIYQRSKKNTKNDADKVIKESLEEVNRLQKLTESLLTIASIKKDKNTRNYQEFDLKTSIDRVVSRLTSQIETKKILIKISGESKKVFANPDEIDQLISIILDNSIKYSGVKKVIKIHIDCDNKHAILSIIDQGTGISKENLPHVFERFYRVDQSRNNKTNGYGLGLSIAKQICQSNGGEIKVTSSIGRGTQVEIVLPLG